MSAPTVEKVSGFWITANREVTFNRVFQGHRFSDDEIAKLLAGHKITVEFSSVGGNPYRYTGRLFGQRFVNASGKEVYYVSFGMRDVPEVLSGHRFTEEEVNKLIAGDKVFATNLVSKKGSRFDVNFYFGKKQDGSIGVIYDFG